MAVSVHDKLARLRGSLAEGRASAHRRFESLREEMAAAPALSRDVSLQAMLSRIKIQSGIIYGEASENATLTAGLPHHLIKRHELS